MRTKHLLTKTLLAIAGLCVGSTSAWAGTTVYDLKTLAGSGYTTASWSTSYVSTTDGEDAVKCYYMSVSDGETVNDFDNRIAVSGNSTSGNPYMRSGYGYFFNTKNRTRYVAIPGLKNGDVVNIVFTKTDIVTVTTVNDFVHSGGTISAGNAISSNTNYTVSTASDSYDLFIKCVIPNEGNAGANNWYIQSVTITSTSETITKPGIAVTGANNGNRTIAITSSKTDADNNTVTYYTKDGSTPSNSSTLYDGAFTVTSSDIVEGKVTIKAITYKDGDLSVASNVSTLELTDVGTTIKLATPTVTLTGMVLENGVYYPQYTFNSVSTGTYGSPSITLTATLGGGNISSPYTANTAGTISVVASAEGYTSSDAAEQVVAGTAYFISKSYDFTDKALRGTYEVSAATSKINNATVYVYGPIATDAITGLTLTASKWGFLASSNSAEAASRSLCARWGAGTLTYDAFASGDILAGTYHGGTSYAMSTTSSIDLAQYAELIALNVYTPIPATAVALASGDAKHLTFKNATSGSSTWENWLIALYGNGTKAAQVRADWWDDIAATNAGFTYGYTYSSDGGTTADNTNVWATFQTDMADADIDFTLSYTGGTFYVIGTMTKGTDVYYVNFSKSGLSGTVYYDLFGNNATLSNITTAATSVVTAPAHPTNVAVTMGSNGYTTYANNVYPLDLTSAPAYKAAVAGSKVNFTLFGQAVPANTGMLVKGTADGTVNLPIADASTAVAGNDFLVNASGATFEAAANTTYYAMIKNSDPLTFGTFAPGTLAFPANKAYLTVVTGGAPSLIAIFDGGQTTGIDAVKGSEFTVDGKYYNLAGQRVAQPTKGLYIVNGKKVVVK